jgi:hypothetical protein
MSSTNTSTITFTQYTNQSIRSISTFATLDSTSSALTSTNWRGPQSPTFPSSPSLALSAHLGKGSLLRSKSNNNNSLLRRPPSNVKRTCFSGTSALIPRMRLLTGRSAVMSGVPWEFGCTPRELHQKEIDIFSGLPQQQTRERERKRPGRGKGKQLTTSEGVVKIALEPINEPPHQIMQDAATSTTDLAAQEGAAAGLGQLGQGCGSEAPKYTRRRSRRLPRCSPLSGGETPSCWFLFLVLSCIALL